MGKRGKDDGAKLSCRSCSWPFQPSSLDCLYFRGLCVVRAYFRKSSPGLVQGVSPAPLRHSGGCVRSPVLGT